MDFINGGELFFHLQRKIRFKEEIAKFFAAEIVCSLECLHSKGIIYRDLKPENILLDSQGHIRITDFGLSKIVDQEMEVAHSFCGTPEYIAPEIIKGGGYGKEIDYWSLGLILYEMLSGVNPFKIHGINKY